MTISEVFDRTIRELESNNRKIKTIKNYRTAKNSFLRVISDIPIMLVSKDHVTLWKEDMMRRAHKSSSIARNVSCLRAALAHAEDLGMNVLKPRQVDRVQVRRSDPTWLVPKEVQSMIDVTENLRDRAMIACLFSMGCRPSEMLNLNRSDVTKDDIIVTNDKTGADYPVVIAPYARKYLDEYLQQRRDTLRPLFVSAQCRRITLSRFEQILHVIADAAKQAFPEAWDNDKNVTPYTLRHGHATDLHENGAPLKEIQAALGHMNIQTTQVYVHLSEERKRGTRRKYHTQLQ